MKIKVWVDRPKCATFASCTIADDPIYILDEEGKAVLDVPKIQSMPGIKSITQEVGDQEYPQWIIECDNPTWVEDNITSGALRCPVFAIVVTDLETGKIIFPEL